MRKELVDVLACPVCKGELELTVTEETGAEIVSGSIHCPGCGATYAIVDTIPTLLPPEGC